MEEGRRSRTADRECRCRWLGGSDESELMCRDCGGENSGRLGTIVTDEHVCACSQKLGRPKRL